MLKIGNQYLNYFGPLVPRTAGASGYSSSAGTLFLLLNNEIKFDTLVLGFEIYASVPGNIQISVIFI